MLQGHLAHFLAPAQETEQKIKKKCNSKKSSYVPRNGTFLLRYQKKSYIFSKASFFYISENGTLHFSAQAGKKLHIYLRKRRPQKLLMFQEINFQTQKKKRKKEEKRKRKHLKNFLYFGKCNFLATNLKNFLYFRKELKRPKKQI